MSNPMLPRSQQVPQHVTALLSHLTSRPGVQSTLILSRKDGRIIQSTGLLAPQDTRPAPTTSTTEPVQTTQPSDSSPTSSAPPTPSTYMLSQAETLATHIFTFVSSASALGGALSRPTQSTSNHIPTALEGRYDAYGNGTSTPREDDKESGDGEREEDDEVKLLRMRTKKHEIVVVPDRKYLLCVVHDAAPGSGAPGAGAARSR